MRRTEGQRSPCPELVSRCVRPRSSPPLDSTKLAPGLAPWPEPARRNQSKPCASTGTLARATFGTRRSPLALWSSLMRWRRESTSSNRTFRASPISIIGKESGCSRSVAGSAPTRSISRGAGAHLTAVDLSSKSLDIARQRAEVMGVADRIEFVQANVEELTSALRGGYDLVYSFGVVHHTPHPERALEQIRALVAPTGTLKLMIYHRRSWKVFWIVVAHGHGRFTKTDELVGDPLRSADRLSSDLQLHARRRAGTRPASRLPGDGSPRRPRLPVPDPRVCRLPVCATALLPLDARVALPEL